MKKEFLKLSKKDDTLDNLSADYLVKTLVDVKDDLTVICNGQKGLLTYCLGSISIPANAFLKANLDYDFFIDVNKKGNASFRADGKMDVSLMASKIAAGGGHVNASGGKFDDFKERASIFKAFGSWENALSMAGVSSNTSRRYSYSKDELIFKLLTICHETNKIPVYRETPFALSVVKAFGSWNNGLIAAGFDINKEFSGKILFSNDELASKYADFSYQIGKNIYGASKNEIDRAFREKKFPCSSGSLVNRFSGFNNLKYICGFKRWKRDVIYSREDLILLLKKKIKEYNRELTIKEINNDRELPGMKTFFSKFNTCSINEIYKIIKNQS